MQKKSEGTCEYKTCVSLTGTADMYILQLISVVTLDTHTVTTIGRNADAVCGAWYTDCAAIGSAH